MTLLSVGLGLVVTFFYMYHAWRLKAHADLGTAINIFIATVGAVGACRIFIFVFVQLPKIDEIQRNDGFWRLQESDGVVFVVGGLALLWVSTQVIRRGFRALQGEAGPALADSRAADASQN